jgi:hypothetical protein
MAASAELGAQSNPVANTTQATTHLSTSNEPRTRFVTPPDELL